MPDITISLDESQYNWLLETVEYEVDYFETLGGDRTEEENQELQRFRDLKDRLEKDSIES
ncbi:hypothetical protein IQ235_09400 [Oscillatoriales cyanobacterium LEGE 11467]|uniref:Uncharacterized protein n=1 Tax=Zarconia navalis LEGE 11467 TaxID=1828826 RepID=A0A928VWT5_9CYAN|nr:hypothetical protein [Zarconia navalis]MBE9040994.1 hypothetical protein [Zarconia navalis LEGE 11467]